MNKLMKTCEAKMITGILMLDILIFIYGGRDGWFFIGYTIIFAIIPLIFSLISERKEQNEPEDIMKYGDDGKPIVPIRKVRRMLKYGRRESPNVNRANLADDLY